MDLRLPTVPRLHRRTAIFWIAVLLTSCAVVAVPALVLESWRGREPPGVHFSMMAQGDMPTYVCYARMAARSATLLSWANAHDVREPPVPVFVNLPITVLGWLAAAGLQADQIDLIGRIAFGLLMCLALAWLLRAARARGIWFWGAFLVISTGGGMTWLAELDLGASLDAWNGAVRARQHDWYWWSLDLVRPLLYPLELAYHSLFFAMMAATMQRRFALANVFLALGCASNPFVGIQMTGVQLASLLLVPRTPWRARVGAGLVAAAFVGYYLGIRLDDVGRALAEQHTGVWREPLSWDGVWVGHGLALIGPLALLCDGRFRRRWLSDATAIPVLALAGWSAILVSHSRFVDHALIPMHFTRGYLWLAGWMMAFAWLRMRIPLPTERGAALRVVAVTLVLVLPDTFFFLRDQYVETPHRPILAWSQTTEDMYRWLRADGARVRRIVVDDWYTGRHVCATSWHRSAFGTPHTTPDWYERRQELERFRRSPGVLPPLLVWADTVLVPRSDPVLARGLARHGFTATFVNPEWTVLEPARFARGASSRAAAPDPGTSGSRP